MSEFKDIFNQEFVKQATETLHALTEDNQAVNRAVLAETLGLLKEVPEKSKDPNIKRDPHTAANSYNAGVQNLLTLMIKEDVIPGYRSDVGIGGGICRADRVRPSKGVESSDVEAVQAALDELLPQDKAIKATREAVAKRAFGEPTAKNCQRVSVAIREGGIQGFTLVTGAKGGIWREHLVPKKGSKPALPTAQTAPAPQAESDVDLGDLSPEDILEIEAARQRSEDLENQFPEE